MLLYIAAVFTILLLYVWKINRGITTTPEEVLAISPKRWTDQVIKEAYEKVKKLPQHGTAPLPPRKNRRYVVVGGSGLSGGWMVRHLLERGEDASAIRILDLRAPTRTDISNRGVAFVQTDVTDAASVQAGFSASWPASEAGLPLTVFHAAALIGWGERAPDLMGPYDRVNVKGTEHVLAAARAVGADILVFTSSGSVGMRAPIFWTAPWEPRPRNFVQILSDASVLPPVEHTDFIMNYTVSKSFAERAVLAANDPENNFRTGSVRPSHPVYGHGMQNVMSLTYDYLRRRGMPTWLSTIIQSFVSSENVSLAHLDFEHALLSVPTAAVPANTPAGRAFYITDPNGPVSFADLYKCLTSMAVTRVSFPIIPVAPILVLSALLELYEVSRHRLLSFLPALTGDLKNCQPAMFGVSTVHAIFSNEQAMRRPEEGGISYKGCVTTLDGFCKSVVEWNEMHGQGANGTANGKVRVNA